MTNGDENRWEELPDLRKVDYVLAFILLILAMLIWVYPLANLSSGLMILVAVLVTAFIHEFIHKYHYQNLDSIDSDIKIRFKNRRPGLYVIPEDESIKIEDYHDNLLKPLVLISAGSALLMIISFLLSFTGIGLIFLGLIFFNAAISAGDFSFWYQTRNYDRIHLSDEKSGQLDIPGTNITFDRYDHDVEIRKEETENEQNIKKETNTDKNLETETN